MKKQQYKHKGEKKGAIKISKHILGTMETTLKSVLR